jgi:putative phosphoesterase
MKIGLISDTHIPKRSTKIPEKVFESFKDVDLILHAGDLTDESVINDLESLAPVIAVQGNVDILTGLDLPKSKVITVGKMKIGLIHGNIRPRGDTQQLYYLAKELDANILVSGHTHIPMAEQIEDVLLLNPGSPTAPRLADPSVMILEITDDNEVDVEVIKIGAPVCSSLQFAQSRVESSKKLD